MSLFFYSGTELYCIDDRAYEAFCEAKSTSCTFFSKYRFVNFPDFPGSFCPESGGNKKFLSEETVDIRFCKVHDTTASSAEMYPMAYLYTHFPVEERNDSQGRLMEERNRCDKMMAEIPEGSMVLLNETFSSTKADVAHDLSTKLIASLIEKDSFGLFVTHFHTVKEFCSEYSKTHDRKICLLVAAVDENVQDRRLYKIVPLESANSSYSRDILFRHRMTREQLFERCHLLEV